MSDVINHDDTYDLKMKEKDGVVIHYSKGYEERADMQLNRVSHMKKYFNDKIGIAIQIKVYLLDKEDWQNIAGEGIPYGLPYVTDDEVACITLPATEDGVIAQGTIAFEDIVPKPVMDMIHETGYTFEESAILFNDLIGYHEIGHILTFNLGLRNLNNWVNEFMATYFAYAYMMKNVIEYAKIWEANAEITYLDGRKPSYTQMDDFDKLYGGVGVENYDWYQKQFTKLASKIYREEGLNFVFKVKEAFENETLDSEAAFEKLGKLSSQVKEWVNEMNKIK